MYALQDFRSNIHGNLTGGITAAVVALPLALAFGISSGVGPVAGLYGAIIVGFFAAAFGGTPSQISGPTGPMTVVMTAVVTGFVAKYPENGLALAFTTVFLGGLIQIAGGLLKLGKYIVMVPYPVISGFMSGIGAIIIVLQLGPLLGHQSGGSIYQTVLALPGQLQNLNPTTTAIGVATLVLIFSWRGRLARLVPAPLVALVLVTLVMQLLLPSVEFAKIGEIPSAVPTIHFPTFELAMVKDMLTNAIILAVLGSIDSLLTSLVADNITNTQHDSDQELIGQGIGNAVAGLLGGLPGAGATMRTMVNVRSGGSGPLSGVVHALVLLAIATGLGFLFENIPLAVLSGILIKVGLDIIDWPFLRQLPKIPWFPAMLMILVFLLTVFVDLITAVFVGVFIKNMVTINKLSDLQLGSMVLSDGQVGSDNLSAEEQQLLQQHQGTAVLLRITGPVSYALGRGLTARFKQFSHCKLLVIDLADANIIGISTAMVLEDIIVKARHAHTDVRIINDGKTTPEISQLQMMKQVGKENCFVDVAQALAV